MTRFRADSADQRRALFSDAIAAHRARESQFCTFEVEGEGEQSPWVQIGERTLNLDCTDEELDRLESLLDGFSAFSIEGLTSPENAEGTNVRVRAFADDDRFGAFTERCFRAVYEQPEGYVVWVTAV